MFEPADLFDLNQTGHAAIFADCKFAWDALKKIEGYLAANLKPALHNTCDGARLSVNRFSSAKVRWSKTA